MEFKYATTRETWEILGIEHFPVTLGSSKINATKELRSLREKGARVVLLSCSAIYVPQVLQQAEQLDMIKEWVWILTDEAISKVRCLIHSWFILLFWSLAEALHYQKEKFILAVYYILVGGPCSSPGRGHRVVFLGKTLLKLTITVPLSTQEYKWIPANCWGDLTNCGAMTCDGLAFRPGGVEIFLATSCYRNRG